MSEVTQILARLDQGDAKAAEELLPLVYNELRHLAAKRLVAEHPGQTLQATALVHEAFLRLVDVPKSQQFNSRGHFFCAAAEAIRRILIENARRKRRIRHGGALRRVPLDNIDLEGDFSPDILALDEALQILSKVEPVVAEVVKLRYFAGLTLPEAASALGISLRTANRHWAFAKAWLFQQLSQ